MIVITYEYGDYSLRTFLAILKEASGIGKGVSEGSDDPILYIFCLKC